MSEQTSNRAEIIIFAVIVAVVALAMAVSAFGEEIGLAIMLIGVALAGWLLFSLAMWVWGKVGDKREDWADRRLNREILAASTRQQLLLAEKSSALVYAQDGFLPVAYSQIVDGTNNGRLLELAAQRIETLRLPENVPSHLHVVTNSDTEQTLNAGASGPNVTGGLGDLNFLLPGQAEKYKVLEEGNSDEQQ